jgi:hypothetical protein
MTKISYCSYRFPSEGAVTLSKEEREKRAARILSSGRDCRAPYVHRRRAKGSVRSCRGEMALNNESVVVLLSQKVAGSLH